MKVRINAAGREVEIDCADVNVAPKDMADVALGLWQATDGPQASPGPAVGFSAQVAVQPSRGTTSMRQEPLRVTSEVAGE